MESTATPSAPITELLRLSKQDDQQAREYLFQAIFMHLRQIAAQKIRKERGAVLEPTELVNEAYINLFGNQNREFLDRGHFMAVAARAMHCILIDLARKRKSAKRNWGDRQVTFNELVAAPNEPWPERLLQFEEVLRRLEKFDERAARIIELRVFVGTTDEEAAKILGVSSRTVKRDYSAAKAWLQAELRQSKNVDRGRANGA